MRRSASLAAVATLIAAISTLGAACAGRDPATPVSVTARTDGPGGADTLRLAAGRRGTVDDGRLTIEFQAISNESRCPSTAVCVWQGDAAAALQLAAEGRRTAATLHTALEPRRVTHGGYELALLNVEPYPDGRPIPPAAYVVVLEVTRQ